MGTSSISDDATLRRAAIVNLAGQVARGLNPLLLVFVARVYGTEALGHHAAAQAVAIIASRIGVFGVDRAMSYYVPRADAAGLPTGLSGALARTVRTAALATLIVVAFALTRPTTESRIVAFINALAVVPFASLEIMLSSLVARKRIDVSMAVRDLIWPMSTSVTALGLSALGVGALGLPIANLFGIGLGFAAAYAAVRATFGQYALTRSGTLPPEVRQMASVLAASDVISTTMVRIDAPILAMVMPASHVGVWAVVTQFVSTVRSLRTGFEGLTTAMVSGIDAVERGDAFRRRLRSALTTASVMLCLTQAPICAAILLFGDLLLGIFGPAFVVGAAATGIACVATALHGWLSLSGSVLIGIGRSRDVFLVGLVALTVHVTALLVLGHTYGLTGGAAALAITAVFHGGAMTLMMSKRLDVFPYDRRMLRLGLTLIAACAAIVALLSVTPERFDWIARASALAVVTGWCVVASMEGRAQADALATEGAAS